MEKPLARPAAQAASKPQAVSRPQPPAAKPAQLSRPQPPAAAPAHGAAGEPHLLSFQFAPTGLCHWGCSTHLGAFACADFLCMPCWRPCGPSCVALLLQALPGLH